MFRTVSLTILAAAILGSAAAYSKAPASAPAGTTGMCKDGSYTSAASKSGACSGHDGVKKWYGTPTGASTAPASSDKGSSSDKSKSKHKAESTQTPAASASAPAAEASPAKASSSSKSKSKSKAESSAPSSASAAAPPAAATGTCKDGSATTAATKSGACSGHGGVKEWYAAGAAGAAAATASAPMSKSAAAPTPTAAPTKSTYTPPAQPAPGGGQGQVWVNKPSKVYHCPGDQWYGKTKDGAYMSEANAIAQGYRADHGKACQ